MAFNSNNPSFSPFGGTTGGFGSTSSNIFGGSQNNNSSLIRTTGTGSLFGSTAATTPAQPAQSGGLFSSGGFTFGSTGNTLGQQNVVVGTTIKFVPLTGSDTVQKNGIGTTISTNHQCITAMKEYESKSLEELRFEDYQANRKFPSNQFGTGATSGLFSGGATTTTGATTGTSTFGTSLFGGGASTAPKPSGFFGAAASTTPATTTTTSTNIFGQSNLQNRSFFGSGTTQPAATGTTGTFGGFGAQPTTTTSVFGTPQQSQPTSIFGGLTSTSTTPTTNTGGLFGSSTTQPSLFGNTQQNKPIFSGFGATATTTTQPTTTQSPFSFGGATTSTTPSLFGGQPQAQSTLGAAKPFGSLTGSTSTTTGFGGFGSPSTATTGTTGGLFGNTATQQAAKPFGSLTGSTSTTTGFGGFGSPASTTQPQTGGSLFGGTGGFGSTTTQQAGATSTTASPFSTGLTGGLGTGTFGSTTTPATGTGLFGATSTQPTQQQTGGSIFGSTTQPATSTGFGGLGGLGTTTTGFGSTQPTLGSGTLGLGQTGTTGGLGGGLFGGTGTTQPSQFGAGLGLGGQTGGGLGSTLGGGTSLFGGGTSTGFNVTGGSSFGSGLGSTLQQQQQQQQAQAAAQSQDQLAQHQLLALSNSPYGTSSLLRLNGSLQGEAGKRDILKPISPMAQNQYLNELTSPSKITSIIPASVSAMDIKGGLSQSLKITPKALSTISMSKKTDLFENLEGEEEVPCFYPRKNIKKLLFKPNSSITSRPSSANSSVNGDTKVDFMKKPTSNYLDDTTNKLSNTTYQIPQITNDFSNVSEDGAGGDNQSENSVNIGGGSGQPPHPAGICLERPGYFTIPALQELVPDQKGDCFAENFAIGRVDYGCITFPGVTNLANMNLDEIVHIRRKEVHVYPDETKKPPQGQGLNKTAEITLHRIWPTDKHTKMPVTDPKKVIAMGYSKKIERATAEMDAQFIDYDPVTGSWTFKVKHFSKYGLHDSDDEDDFEIQTNKLQTPGASKTKTLNFGLMTASSDDNGSDQFEREMLARQMKLIETRRLELMQRKSMGAGGGGGVNAFNNHQWELLNEYMGSEPSKQQPTEGGLQLKLAESGDETGLIDEDDDRQSSYSNNQFGQKRADVELEEEDKENRLYPSLSELKKSKLFSGARGSGAKEINKLYPSLPEYNMIDDDQKETLKLPSAAQTEPERGGMSEQQPHVLDDLPFVSKANKFRMSFFNDDNESDLDTKDILDIDQDAQLKMPNLIQRPAGPTLLKRGLGLFGEETAPVKTEPTLATSLIGAGFGQKPARPAKLAPQQLVPTATILSIADVQQKIGSRILKPRLLNRYLIYKTSSSSSGVDASLRGQDQFDHQFTASSSADQLKTAMDKRLQELNLNAPGNNQVVPASSAAAGLIKFEESITYKLFACVADAGLFNSRRFRINWSASPNACTYVQLGVAGPHGSQTSFFNAVQIAAPAMFSKVCPARSGALALDLSAEKAKVMRENCTKYLRIQLESTDFVPQPSVDGAKKHLAHLRPKFGNELIRRCCECVTEIRNSIGDNPDADNVEHMKQVWSLCQSLWGDLPESNIYNSKLDELNAYEVEQIRKRLLTEWLTDICSHRIEKENKQNKFSKNKDSYLSSIFSLLTGNRLLDACNVAADNQDFRLALLLAQSSGGNNLFREMIRKQLKDWLNSGTDKYLNSDRLKLFVLMAGDICLSSATSKLHDINVCENLDWKRQFAIHLWYNSLPVNSIYDALNLYESSVKEGLCNQPLPPYLEDCSVNSDAQGDPKNALGLAQNRAIIYDTCYHLIKLYCDSNHSLADIIAPLNHSSNQLDFRLSWHLTMSLNALKYNQITSTCLENLHHSFATQLQAIGLWYWSVFVLMHIADKKRREQYIQLYISKNVSSSVELSESEKFVINELNVPAELVFEYKALRAKYEHLYENQIELLIKAHKWNEAHIVLVEYLAPDYFIQENLTVLHNYLVTLSKESHVIHKWSVGGQIYLEFIKLNQKAQELFYMSDNIQQTEKWVSDEFLAELRDQANALSARVKEFDCKTPKKLLCCINISKLLLKLFNFLYELKVSENSSKGGGEDEEDMLIYESGMGDSLGKGGKSKGKLVTSYMIEKACQLTDNVPDEVMNGTMQMKKAKFAIECINRRF